ncbi:uncharacterized protein LOC119602503 [Lucilia sericata]|uniref:uncharacterized protein LOC119602503 n=1 Tax=Lucilia sericata TaxID=13632 RepID=UPI0018A809E3|nr:uncharacterized protein LOC119602503 [Lucilia sericata]
MIIVLLLFFKSICLYCQRLVLHIHDRWINPKNVRLLKEAAEAKGSKFQIEEYRQVKKSKRRRYAASSASANISPLSNSLADSDNCRFCANTPQGYCRHHFHLQELQVQKQQRQQKFWCPLSGVVNGSNRSTEYRQLRKIKRELKRNIQQQQQLKSSKAQTIIYEPTTYSTTNTYPPPSSSPSDPTYQSNSLNSSYCINDSGYQTISVSTSSTLESEENSDLLQQQQQSELASIVDSNSIHDYVDIELPSPSASLVETTYSFETCCETPQRSPASNSNATPIPKTASYNSFVSCEYSTLSTSYL